MARASLHSAYSSSHYHGSTTQDMDPPVCIATHLLCENSDPLPAVNFQNVVHFRSITVQACSCQVYNDILSCGTGHREQNCLLALSPGQGIIRYYYYCHVRLTDCMSQVFQCSRLCPEHRGTILVSGAEFHQSAAQMHYDGEPMHH